MALYGKIEKPIKNALLGIVAITDFGEWVLLLLFFV